MSGILRRFKSLSERKRKLSIATIAKKSRRSKYIIILGGTKSGKSSFVRQLMFGSPTTFTDSYTPTTEDFHEKCHLYRNHAFNLEIVDTGAPFDYPAMRDMNITRAHIAILVYDVTSVDSMKTMRDILSIVVQLRGPKNPLHCIFVGNKMDLFSGDDEGEIYRMLGMYIDFYPDWMNCHKLTSAKLGFNITEALELALDHILSTTPEDCYDVRTYDDAKANAVSCCGMICRFL